MSKDIESKKKFSDKKIIENKYYLNNKFYLEIISYIKSSKYRREALQIFMKSEEAKTPSEMSKLLGIGLSHTCKILKDLKDDKLIICTNENDRKNKKLIKTELGKDIGNIIINHQVY